jgi:membrane protein YqaA with SNARE-associated domain
VTLFGSRKGKTLLQAGDILFPMTPDAAAPPHSLATASGLLLGTTAAAMVLGALLGWALGSWALGLLIGMLVGIAAVYLVYARSEAK